MEHLFERYVKRLRKYAADGKIDARQMDIIEEFKEEDGITEQMHASALKELGISGSEWKEMVEAGKQPKPAGLKPPGSGAQRRGGGDGSFLMMIFVFVC